MAHLLHTTLVEIMNDRYQRVKTKATRWNDARPLPNITSSADYRDLVNTIKVLCSKSGTLLKNWETCQAACHDEKFLTCPERLCPTHKRWVESPAALDTSSHTAWEELEKCPDCLDTTHCFDEEVPCLRTCVQKTPLPNIKVQMHHLTQHIEIRQETILFLIWYCYTQVCSGGGKLLRTAGIMEWLLLGTEYESRWKLVHEYVQQANSFLRL
jgi:hypothetical protein